MAVYRRPARTRNLLAILVLVALTLVTIDARDHGTGAVSKLRSHVADVFAPLQRGTHDVLAPIGDFLSGAVDYGSLRRENQRLRAEVAALQTQAASAAADQQRAEQVLGEQNLPFAGGVARVTAAIIDSGFSNFDNTVTVDKGTAAGVAVGQPVVAAGGLVGTVLSASSRVATIRLLTDPSFDVGVVLQGGNVGSAAGAGSGESMRVTVDTPQDPRPANKVGDVLVTSGLAMEKFPPGIPVGRIVRLTNPPGAAEPDISLAPLVNPTRIGFVQILLWAPSQ